MYCQEGYDVVRNGLHVVTTMAKSLSKVLVSNQNTGIITGLGASFAIYSEYHILKLYMLCVCVCVCVCT